MKKKKTPLSFYFHNGDNTILTEQGVRLLKSILGNFSERLKKSKESVNQDDDEFFKSVVLRTTFEWKKRLEEVCDINDSVEYVFKYAVKFVKNYNHVLIYTKAFSKEFEETGISYIKIFKNGRIVGTAASATDSRIDEFILAHRNVLLEKEKKTEISTPSLDTVANTSITPSDTIQARSSKNTTGKGVKRTYSKRVLVDIINNPIHRDLFERCIPSNNPSSRLLRSIAKKEIQNKYGLSDKEINTETVRVSKFVFRNKDVIHKISPINVKTPVPVTLPVDKPKIEQSVEQVTVINPCLSLMPETFVKMLSDLYKGYISENMIPKCNELLADPGVQDYVKSELRAILVLLNMMIAGLTCPQHTT